MTGRTEIELSSHPEFPSLYQGRVEFLIIGECGDSTKVGKAKVSTISPVEEGICRIGGPADMSSSLLKRVRGVKNFLDIDHPAGEYYSRVVAVMNVEVKEEYRGNRIGHKMVESLVNLFPGPDTIFSIFPYPMDEEEDDWGKDQYERYWKEMGFCSSEDAGRGILILDCHSQRP